ncbi:hypothetical protein JCM19233_5458 [Vibrio astriarenae]|nr:hypothetical protein JCM19233_5458 [Vibrio sp. C7]
MPNHLTSKLEQGWESDVMEKRTRGAIDFVARLLPSFTQANCAGTPLFGAQQIPGNDDTLRAADVSFAGDGYARLEIVKARPRLKAQRPSLTSGNWSMI